MMPRRHAIALAAGLCLVTALSSSAAGPAAKELRPFTARSLDSIRAAHAGRPFVLAFWSITCEPCREEMAEWRALREKHPGVPVVLVSTDAPGDRAAVSAFLARYDPGRVESWIFADEFVERVRYAVDPRWRGELPRTYLFDSRHRAEGRSGRFDRGWIEGWLVRQPGRQPPRE